MMHVFKFRPWVIVHMCRSRCVACDGHASSRRAGPTNLGYHCWPIVSCISWQHMSKVIGRILSKRTKSGIIGPRILRDTINFNWGAF